MKAKLRVASVPIIDFLPRLTLAREGWLRLAFVGAGLIGLFRLRGLLKPNLPTPDRHKASPYSGRGKLNAASSKVSGKVEIKQFFLTRLALTVVTTARNLWLGLFAYMLYFYRDPQRDPIASDPHLIYAPADGKLISIEEVDEPKFIGGRAICLTFKVRPWYVQLQRAPIAGQLRYLFIEMAADERTNYLGFTGIENRRATLAQRKKTPRLPAFLSERRPASVRLDAGQPVSVGQKLGINSFGLGSRVQLFLPADNSVELVAQPGNFTQAGMTVLGRFRA